MKLLLEVMMAATGIAIVILLVVMLIKIHRNERDRTPD